MTMPRIPTTLMLAAAFVLPAIMGVEAAESVPDRQADIFADEFDTMRWFDVGTGEGVWRPTGKNGTSVGEGASGWGAEFHVHPLTNTLGINPYCIENGMLTIVTNRAPAGIQQKIGGCRYTSGAFRSVRGDFGYGYYEMRAMLPAGRGNWPAFWLLPGDRSWPPEIDVVEMLGNAPTKLITTVHSTRPIPNPTSNPHANHFSLTKESTVADMTEGFHTYGLDYRADTLTWYFDRQPVFTAATPPDLVDRAMYIILDNAIGGWNDNAVDDTTIFPARFSIDYVRVHSARPF